MSFSDNRSHSTPHALRCNCHERPEANCPYSHDAEGPFVIEHRKLDVDPRPECTVCHQFYEFGLGIQGVCPDCRAAWRVIL